MTAGSGIAHRRLLNQRLALPMVGEPGGVIQWLGAVQAQDYASAKWALGLRLQGATDADIESAFDSGALLRTHVMRPTWHFVTPADIRWMLALTAPRIIAGNARRYRELELDQDTLMRSDATVERALRDGQQLTRDEMRDALERAGIATHGQRLSHILAHIELVGIACSGARHGKQHTHALLEERVPPAKPLRRDEALATLVKRYFSSHGPATLRDFAWWSGLTVADAKVGLSLLGSEMLSETIDDVTYWCPASGPHMSKAEAASPSAYLLPNYDEYTVGYQDRSAILDPSRENLVALDTVIVLHGHIVGTWQRTMRKDTVAVETKMFTALAEPENEAVAVAARRYGAFLGLSTVLIQA
jgi:hypothetical protein